jgi:2-polyprenyl-6-methoxyphenol hydroxylase-like FAD-dependent oxidoreductase
MLSAGHPDTADAVVVGGGTVGAWCAYFLRRAGLRVVLLEKGILGTSGITLWAGGEQEVGVWECTPGPSYWKLETHEAVHIVSGRMTVTPDGGEP